MGRNVIVPFVVAVAIASGGCTGARADVNPAQAAKASLAEESAVLRVQIGSFRARGVVRMRPPQTTIFLDDATLVIHGGGRFLEADGQRVALPDEEPTFAVDDVPAVLNAIASSRDTTLARVHVGRAGRVARLDAGGVTLFLGPYASFAHGPPDD